MVFEQNAFKIPFDNRGGYGNSWLIPDSLKTTQYNNDSFILYAAGFMMTGKLDTLLWCNGTFDAGLHQGYLPGTYANPDPNQNIFRISKNDTAFGKAWQQWKAAVDLGAPFFDGDNDGVYNPVDKNLNGQWDEDEDKPLFQGDKTIWLKYYDGEPQESRGDIIDPNGPVGIEIEQSVFGWESDTTHPLYETIFIRYILENTGIYSNVLDSLYFAPAIDPDIGQTYQDDWGVSDLASKAGFGHDNTNNWKILYDPVRFITRPPALGLDIVVNAQTRIPGVTYKDLNGNGRFDGRSDIPLSEVTVFRGPDMERVVYPGASDVGTHAVRPYPKDPYDPDSRQDVRWLTMGGRNKSGAIIDPCTYPYGNGPELEGCDTLNPLFMFSGDPESGTGWFMVSEYDIRVLVSTGPFRLEKGHPVEFLVAFTVTRGENHLNSVTKGKKTVQWLNTFYQGNFSDFTSLPIEKPVTPTESQLLPNYPNPFNASTTISYLIAGKSLVTLTVYDALGREIRRIENDWKTAGLHKVTFDAGALSSGIYYYRLNVKPAGGKPFTQTRKALLIK